MTDPTTAGTSSALVLYGLTTLAQGEAPISADIVFVHGFNGHPIRTWSSGDICWPRDLLPRDIPHARIITFGYDAGLEQMPSISHVSDNLLEDLTTARRDNESRPLLFVGHSLGGIVIKDTLIRSSQYQNTGGNARLGSIYQSTVGIVFFGTPHHGSFEAPLERIVTNILQDSNPAKRIVRPVNPEFFEQQAMNFREIAETLPTVDIFELLPTHTINGSKLIVPESSAFQAMPLERRSGIHKSHFELTKFSSEHDNGYRTSAAHIERLLLDAVDERTPLLDQQSVVIPRGAIESISSDGRSFRVRTKDSCGGIYEDILNGVDRKDAEKFYLLMNTYDESQPTPFLYPQWVYNLIWTFFTPKGLEVISEEADPSGKSRNSKGKQPDLERQDQVSRSSVQQTGTAESGSSSQPHADSSQQPRGRPASPGTNPDPLAYCKIYLAVGHESSTMPHFELSSCKFPYSGEGDICAYNDVNLFKALRAEALKTMGPNFLKRFIFPCRILSVKYYEFWHEHAEGVRVPENGENQFPNQPDKTHDSTSSDGNDRDANSTNETCRKTDGWKYKFETGDINMAWFNKEKLTKRLLHPERAGKHYWYGERITRKSVVERNEDIYEHKHIWGLVIHKEFDYLTSVLIWSMTTFLISLAVVLVLVALGPLRGNFPGIFAIIFGFMALANTWAIGVSTAHAKLIGLSK